jgi:hypothetical protein
MEKNLYLTLLPIFAVPVLGIAQTVVYPDLQVITPTTEFSIGINSTTSARELRFSHITWNAGAGPLEIRPGYNSTTHVAQPFQRLYSRNASGGLVVVRDDLVAVPMHFDDPSDYAFPLSAFWLYADVGGSLGGEPLRMSPKIDFCMTEDFKVSGGMVDGVIQPTVPNTPASVVYNPDNCSNPSGILGLSVGWGDKYDYLDTGENIDLTGLPDGVYWLRSVANPYHLLQESDPSNNVTDTQLRITGNTVQVVQQQHPNSTPPTVTLTSPAPGASVNGVITLTATATPPDANSSVQNVRFLVDGQQVGGQW